MDAFTFEGWVEKILPADQFKQTFSVRNYKYDADKEVMKHRKEFPFALMFTANVRNGANAQLDDVHEGDKVKVSYYVSGFSGISKKTGQYYCFNSLNIAKKDGVVVTSRTPYSTENGGIPMPASDDDDMSIPF